MHHGSKSTFEIVGEQQVIDGKSQTEPGVGFRFGRIFHTLPPFRPTDASLDALGKLMTQEFAASNGPIPAGYTYFGQFVDHDITKDDTPGRPENIQAVDNADLIKQARSPSLDLDSLYGQPDTIDPKLAASDGRRFRLGRSSTSPLQTAPADKDFEGADVPRVATPGPDLGKAIIGDERNDENLIIQQLHLAFLKFHNKVVDHFEAQSPDASSSAIFAQARDLVTRHYQWIVINDFVRRLVSPQVFRSVFGVSDLDGAATISPNPLIFKVSAAQIPPMPLEFSAAAYRLGHSMVREDYGWNRFFPPGTGFDLFFRFTHLSGDIGRRPIFTQTLNRFPSNWIADWRRMFEMEIVQGEPPINRQDVPLNRARLIDTHLAPVLGTLPDPVKGSDGNLAVRNLIRGSRNGLPSGQDIAAEIVKAGDKNAKPMSPADILRGLPDGAQKAITNFEFHTKTPLWFYILKEAENGGGQHLGPVGSRIIAETFLALVRASVITIFNGDPAHPDELSVFAPASSPLRTPGNEPLTSMPHLLSFVGDVNPLG